jgi:hypothetical protein
VGHCCKDDHPGDLSSPLGTNLTLRKNMQAALNARFAMTKDGVSIKVIRDAKKAAAEVNPKLPNDKRFFSNGLSKTKITPPVMLQLTPPVKNPVTSECLRVG